MISSDYREVFEPSFAMVGLLRETTVTAGWGFEMRKELVLEWEERGRRGSGRIYGVVVVLMEMAHRLPVLEGGKEGDGPLSLGGAESVRW